MIFDTLTVYEKEMVLIGFDKMSRTNQDNLVSAIAKKLNIALWQVRTDDILAHHKAIKLAMMNEFYEIAIAKGFIATNGHHYRSNGDDQINFLGKMLAILMNPNITEVQWKTEDIGYIVHTKEEWLQVAFDGITHKETQIMKYNEKDVAITNATTHEQIVQTIWEGSESLI